MWLWSLPCSSDCFRGYFRAFVAPSVWLQLLLLCFHVVADNSVWLRSLSKLLLCLCGSFRVVAVTSGKFRFLPCGCDHFRAVPIASEVTSMPSLLLPCGYSHFCVATMWLRSFPCGSDCFRSHFHGFVAATVWLQSFLCCFHVVAVTSVHFQLLLR